MTLRSDATQAIAEEVCESYGEEGPCDDHVRKAGSVLDALLIFLGSHTDEWEKAAVQRVRERGFAKDETAPNWESDLIAVLRVEP